MVRGLYAIGESNFLALFEKYANFFADGMEFSTDDNFHLRYKRMA